MSTDQFIAVTKDGKIRNPNEPIFPILKQLDDDNWRLISTGFFITKYGLFLTAKHVLRDVLNNETNEQTHPIAAFLFLPESKFTIRRVMKGFLNVGGDVAAGIIANIDETGKLESNPYYGLCRTPLTVNDKIHTYAYPETTHSGNKINFVGNYYDGIVEEYLPNGRDYTMLPNSCYRTNMKILGGASGGPVFNSSGNVIGINSTGFNDAEPPYISYVSSINDFFNIITEGIMLPCGYKKNCTLEDLCNLGYIISSS